MNRVLRIALVALSLSSALAVAAVGQDTPPTDRYWLLHQETVRPPGVASFEAASKDFVATVKANKAAMPHFNFLAFADDSLTYTFAVPIPSFAGVDAVNQDFGALAEALGAEKFGALMARSFAEVERVDELVVVVPAGLSYHPATPRLKPEEIGFYHFDFYAAIPGREWEAEALAKEFAALYKAKNVPDGYTFNKVALGADMPLYFVSVGARDAADYYTAVANAQKLVGAEGQALFARAFALSRKVWSRNATFRPDLSVPPPASADR